MCVADTSQTSKLREANTKISKLQGQVDQLTKDLAVSQAEKATAVLQAELKLQAAHYKALQEAVDKGYNRAIQQFKDMKQL